MFEVASRFLPSARGWNNQFSVECGNDNLKIIARRCVLARNGFFMSDIESDIHRIDFSVHGSLRWFVSLLDTIADDSSLDLETRRSCHHLSCLLNHLKYRPLLTDKPLPSILGLTTPVITGDLFDNMVMRYRLLASNESSVMVSINYKLDELLNYLRLSVN